ncbi:MAG TPA: protein phosphatase 2C domain-containing protein [Candidatus Binataceae bacterium]|nr:protein phosphatase 2C domain-containing protein [Candidatus Binataceae bacterium]
MAAVSVSEAEHNPSSLEPVSHAGIFDLALLSDVGTERPGNEDSCGHLIDDSATAVFAVADGIGGYEGGEVASAMAIELMLQAWSESPAAWGASKRLARAVQFANIEIHNRALAVPELRRMGTTLTAVAVEKGMLAAAHVGDCRLYLVRHHKISQLTKDHTMVAEKVRMGLLSPERARNHPERSMLVRSIGQELIVSVDRISMPLVRGDRLILCSDGLHNVMRDNELEQMTRDLGATAACRELIETANARGTADNLTVAVFTMLAETGLSPTPTGWRAKLGRMFRRGA